MTVNLVIPFYALMLDLHREFPIFSYMNKMLKINKLLYGCVQGAVAAMTKIEAKRISHLVMSKKPHDTAYEQAERANLDVRG